MPDEPIIAFIMACGICFALGANLTDSVACVEATNGTVPKCAGKDYVNPGSGFLSAAMMLRHRGWMQPAGFIDSSMKKSNSSLKGT